MGYLITENECYFVCSVKPERNKKTKEWELPTNFNGEEIGDVVLISKESAKKLAGKEIKPTDEPIEI